MTNASHNKVVTRRQVKTGIWTAASVLLTLATLLFVSTIDNPDGTPWLESTVVGQSIAMLALVAAAVLPTLLGARRDSAVVREQIENTHVEDPSKISNVRDDLDSKHEILLTRLDRMEARNDRQTDALASDIRGMRRDFGRLFDKSEDNAQRIARIEGKHPRRPISD